jgi:sterol desaturase/sphingolipid hydroxylase (fatty acid hydroxylase superfamily)
MQGAPAWMDTLLAEEPWLRLTVFAGVLLLMVVWEIAAPRRAGGPPRAQRWPGNLGLVIVDTVLLRLVFPTAAVGVAVLAEQRAWGLVNLLSLPPWLTVVGCVFALDLIIYLQHVLFHAVPSLWRLHRVHHTDLAFDVTTGLRFHPVEILLSMMIKMVAIAGLGAPAVAVLIFEIVLNATAMFNHGNVRIPAAIERWLRLVVVTPEMHRVHHSIVRNETNSNFGFNFPWWDRWFGTYRAQPAAGHRAMIIGVEQFREARDLRLDRLLLQPWLAPPSTYPVNRGPER